MTTKLGVASSEKLSPYIDLRKSRLAPLIAGMIGAHGEFKPDRQ